MPVSPCRRPGMAARGRQRAQVLEGGGGVGAQAAGFVEHAAFAEGQRGGAVQQLAGGAQAALGRAHEAGLHLDGGHARPLARRASAGCDAARGVRHGHVEQRHQHAAVRHVPGVEVGLGQVQPQLGLAAAEAPELEAEMLDEGMRRGKGSAAPCSPAVHRRHAAVHGQDLPGDVLAGGAGEQQRGALQVVVVAQALQRRCRGQLLGAEGAPARPASSCSGRSPAPAR